MSKNNITQKNHLSVTGKISRRVRRLFVKRKYKDELFRKIFNNSKVLLNYGRNMELMKRCRTLEEYSIFISRVAEGLAQGMELEDAIDKAVEECINEGVLEMFLRKHKAEVSSVLFEFDMKEYVKMEKRDSYADGILEGKELGMDLERLRSVDALMKNLNIDLQKACEGVGITVEDYENAKKRVHGMKEDKI